MGRASSSFDPFLAYGGSFPSRERVDGTGSGNRAGAMMLMAVVTGVEVIGETGERGG